MILPGALEVWRWLGGVGWEDPAVSFALCSRASFRAFASCSEVISRVIFVFPFVVVSMPRNIDDSMFPVKSSRQTLQSYGGCLLVRTALAADLIYVRRLKATVDARLAGDGE